ncbi:MAG: hypothetical protein M3285_03185 [Actinomycetota bacterium]|nr:hypothetical protein [Actinomycetota bacterium]MDQ3954536.1 hypothetical protein [Actinomycetota bacterium]
MRARLTAVLTIAVVVTTSPGALGGTVEPRHATLPYAPTDDNFVVGGPEDYAVAGTGDGDAQYDFAVEKGEKAVEVFIQDDTELPVAGIVTQWKQTDHRQYGPASATTYVAATWKRFCGQTDAPVPLKPKLEVRIIVMEGTCLDGTPSAPTTGQIVVDFHRSEPSHGKAHLLRLHLRMTLTSWCQIPPPLV